MSVAARVRAWTPSGSDRPVATRLDHLLRSPWRWLGLPGWCVYRPLVALRNTAYDLGWKPILRLPVPVISIGNLAVGGTGKTPMVAWIAAHLSSQGHRPAILMRGYRSDANGTNDEARLFTAPVVCNADRVAGGQRAIADGATCLLLDDGFQHRRLHRDLDLVLIDATCPWGGGAVLPLGLLREGLGSLARAQAVIVTRSDQVDAAALAAIDRRLSRWNIPIMHARHAPVRLTSLQGSDSSPPELLRGRPVLLASGIGNPVGFERTAAALGWSITGHRRFPDHHPFTQADADALAQAASAANATLVVTDKDAVKLRALSGLNGWSLAIELAFADDGAARVKSLLDTVLAAKSPSGSGP